VIYASLVDFSGAISLVFLVLGALA